MPGVIMSTQKSVADGGLQFLFIFILHKDIYMRNRSHHIHAEGILNVLARVNAFYHLKMAFVIAKMSACICF